MNRIFTPLFFLFFIFSTIGLSSCVNEVDKDFQEEDLRTYSLYLQAPLSTRAANNDEVLMPQDLGIYVFTTEDNEPKKLADMAVGNQLNITLVSGSTNTNSKYKLEFKIASTIKGRLMATILANTKFNPSYEPKNGDSYDKFEKGLTHQLNKKNNPRSNCTHDRIFCFRYRL